MDSGFGKSILGISFQAALDQLHKEEIEEASRNMKKKQQLVSQKKKNYRESAAMAFGGNNDDADDDDDDGDFATQLELAGADAKNLDNLLAQIDDPTQPGLRPDVQKVIWWLFEETMTKTLKEMQAPSSQQQQQDDDVSVQNLKKNVPKTQIIIKAQPARGASSSSSSSAAAAASSDSSSTLFLSPHQMQFPMYRKIGNKWKIILENPQVLIHGAASQAVSRDSGGVKSKQNDQKISSSVIPGINQKQTFSQVDCDYAVLYVTEDPTVVVETAKQQQSSRKTAASKKNQQQVVTNTKQQHQQQQQQQQNDDDDDDQVHQNNQFRYLNYEDTMVENAGGGMMMMGGGGNEDDDDDDDGTGFPKRRERK